MWRCRHSVNRNFRFTCRLLLWAGRCSEKLVPGTRRAEEERFGSHGGLKAREGTGSEGDGDRGRRNSASGTTSTPSGARRSILVAVPSPEGGASGERREASRGGQPGRSGRALASAATVSQENGRCEARVRRSGRRRDGSGGTGLAGRAATARGGDGDVPAGAPRTRRTGGTTQSVSPLSRVRGLAARSCPAVAGLASTLRPERRSARAKEARMWRPGSASSRGVRFVSRPDTLASDLGPARLTPHFISAISYQQSAFSQSAVQSG